MLKAIHGCSGFAVLLAPNPRGCCNPVTSDAPAMPGSQEIVRSRNWRNSVILIQEQDMRNAFFARTGNNGINSLAERRAP